MKIPKRIEKVLIKRAKAAENFNEADYELSAWLDKHGIETETCDTHGGVEAIVNPFDSAERIRQAIIEAL